MEKTIQHTNLPSDDKIMEEKLLHTTITCIGKASTHSQQSYFNQQYN